MTRLVVPDIDDATRARLTDLARRHGRSIEEEAREILRSAVGTPQPEPGKKGLGSRIAGRFAQIGLEEGIPELRGQFARPADLTS